MALEALSSTSNSNTTDEAPLYSADGEVGCGEHAIAIGRAGLEVRLELQSCC